MFSKECIEDLAMIKREYNKSYDITISKTVKDAILAYNPEHPSFETAWHLCQTIADDKPFSSFGFITHIQEKSKLIQCISLLKNRTQLLVSNHDVFNKIVKHESLIWFHDIFTNVILSDRNRRFQHVHAEVYFDLIIQAPCAEISSRLIIFLLELYCPEHAKEQFSLIWKTLVTKKDGRYKISGDEDGSGFLYTFEFILKELEMLSSNEKHRIFLEKLTHYCSEIDKFNKICSSSLEVGAPKTSNRLQLAQATALLASLSLISHNPSQDNAIQNAIRNAIQIRGYEPPSFSPLIMAEAIIALSNSTLAFIQPLYSHSITSSFFDHSYQCVIERDGRVISSRLGNIFGNFGSSREAEFEYYGYVGMLIQAISEERNKPKQFVDILNALHRPGLLDRKDLLTLFECLLLSGYDTISQKLQRKLDCREDQVIEKVQNMSQLQLLSLIDSHEVISNEI